MRHVDFIPPVEDPDWQAWLDKASKERDELVAAWEMSCRTGTQKKFKPKIKDDLYKKARRFLVPLFKKKCAYCEIAIPAIMIRPDVEHFRPKLAIKHYKYGLAASHPRYNEHAAKFEDSDVTQHGYFWLVYNIANLLPACEACNRWGKANFFPVELSRLCCPEDDHFKENPMLLNPYVDDPNEHLAFDDEFGYVRPLSVKGAISIDVYGLNRDGLWESRREAISLAKMAFNNWMKASARGTDDEQVTATLALDRIANAEEKHTAAARTAIGTIEERIELRGQITIKKRRGIWPSTLRTHF